MSKVAIFILENTRSLQKLVPGVQYPLNDLFNGLVLLKTHQLFQITTYIYEYCETVKIIYDLLCRVIYKFYFHTTPQYSNISISVQWGAVRQRNAM